MDDRICTRLPETLPTAFDEKKKRDRPKKPRSSSFSAAAEHNAKEKIRRKNQRSNFKRLSELLPRYSHEQDTKNSILERAIARIEELERIVDER